MHQELIDGSRAANLLGWQWTVGSGNRKPCGFARWQVQKRAPQLCGSCALKSACPIEKFPADRELSPVATDPLLGFDPSPEITTGPRVPIQVSKPDLVLLTIESLGDSDPAMAANPDLPVAFVFNEQGCGHPCTGSKLREIPEPCRGPPLPLAKTPTLRLGEVIQRLARKTSLNRDIVRDNYPKFQT